MNLSTIFKSLFVSLGVLTAANPMQAQQLPVTQMQLNLGRLLPADSVQIYLEYPELTPLDRVRQKQLQAQGFVPGHDVQLSIYKGVSRGETLADVSFVPIVQRNGKWYEVSRYELRTRHVGPSLSPAQRTMVRAMQVAEAASRYASHSVLAQGKWVKIQVTDEGVYQLNDADLQKMGFNDPAKVRLYGYGGRLLPDKFSFEGADALIDDLNEVPLYRRNGSSLFFAEGLVRHSDTGTFSRNTFANGSCYFLTEATEGQQPAAWQVLEKPAEVGTTVDEVGAWALIDNDQYVWYGGGRDFFDTNELMGGHRFKLSLPGYVGGDCQVWFDLSAQNASSTTVATIDHENSGTQVAKFNISIYGEGESAHGYRGSFTAPLTGDDRFNVTTTSTGRLNYLYAPYRQHLRADCTTHAFSPSTEGCVALQVGAATANTRVWQLGDARQAVAELPGLLSGDIYTAQSADGTCRFVCVDVAATYPTPQVVGTVANQDLHADGALDYVIVIPASGRFAEQAERLAEAHRTRSGMRVKVVRADQLFNEFSSGTPDAAAYRRYMKMLYDRAATEEDQPRYLLLFGNCTYDNRMVTADWRGVSPDDYLLAYERNDQETYMNTNYSIGTLHSYVTDDYFGFLDDGEGVRMNAEKLDLGIGRFLCQTNEEAVWLVDQAIDYLNGKQAGAWQNQMWAVADTGDENLHMNDAQKVAGQVEKDAGENFLLRRIFPDIYTVTQEAKGATYPEATEKLKQAMQHGALVFNYNGHGSPDRISHKFLLNKEEMLANESEARPVWIFASCEITPYDQVSQDLGRNALYCPNGPAVAVLCASRSVYANYNRALNMGFVHFAFSKDAEGRRYTLGDALRLTKCELLKNTTVSIGTDQTVNKMKYALLGDPALTLAYPDAGLRIDSVNGQPVSGADARFTLPIGSKVRLSGSVVREGDEAVDTQFNGGLSATVLAPLQTLTCKGAGNSKVSPLVYTDYTNTIYEGEVAVVDGRFTVEFVVPRGLTFSDEVSVVSLYAADRESGRYLNGRFAQCNFSGTAPSQTPDVEGPEIYLYINRPDFVDGATVGRDASFFYAAVSDTSGISMITGNLGHDMEMWFDNDPSTVQRMNNWFSFELGSYQQGLVTYPLPALSPGMHTISFRAWDVFDNATTATLQFRMIDQSAPTFDVRATPANPTTSTRFVTVFTTFDQQDSQVRTEVYDVLGRRVWHTEQQVPAGNAYATESWNLCDYAGNRLNSGVYFYRSVVNGKETGTRRLLLR